MKLLRLFAFLIFAFLIFSFHHQEPIEKATVENTICPKEKIQVPNFS